jgi:hypothetical protein
MPANFTIVFTATQMERRQALGRATWTVLHTTAAYLSDNPTPAERQGFASLAASISVLYPGETQVCSPSYSFSGLALLTLPPFRKLHCACRFTQHRGATGCDRADAAAGAAAARAGVRSGVRGSVGAGGAGGHRHPRGRAAVGLERCARVARGARAPVPTSDALYVHEKCRMHARNIPQ